MQFWRSNPLIIFLDSSMVEHSAVNRVVVGSSPTRGAHISYMCQTSLYERPHGQAVKTSPFHGGNTSSNLVGVIYQSWSDKQLIWRHSQVVRRGSATPWSPVRIWLSPLSHLTVWDDFFCFINNPHEIDKFMHLYFIKLTNMLYCDHVSECL